jgi:DNA-binding MarR family transcriptional regulator
MTRPAARRLEQPRGVPTPANAPQQPPLRAIDGDATAALALDRIIHERVRLGLLSALAVNDVLTFNDLKSLLETTDGNISVHARKLEDAGYLRCSKGFDGRVPRTEYRITSAGREALELYLSHMEALIRRVGGE